MPQDPARNADSETPTVAGAAVVPGKDAAPAPAAPKIKLDGASASQPMRPAARLPKLPGDDEAPTTAIPAPAGPGDKWTQPLAGVAPQQQPAPATAPEKPADTSMLSMRPPAEEVARRQAAMEKAANTKPVLTRVFQVLLAVFYPVVLLVLAIRVVTSNVFLWVEYHRPGFPADSFGFSTEDRVTYGSYTVDYLLNFAPPRFLGGLVDKIGNPLFLDREVGHMADVKSVIVMAFIVGLVLAAVMVVAMVYLARRTRGGIRRGLFAGSIATLAVIVGLGVFAVTGWEAFFTEFHKIFFADGTWTFYTDDTLIRLFPSQFWMDAGIFIGVFVLVVSSLTLAFTWPTKERRHAAGKTGKSAGIGAPSGRRAA
ncbi:integral membrane protein (TIGR01906 family) [Arthrobacter stackebrandtii]|uniref:Integral membrane protein (TIGR01906 family) n=2 Tax=Arthrobacter stackebrandtii TaxID=272161 RepID=A0ABS4YS11_9MICC|nr:TIGR01906 family membrane protein [Arthrobacter stackebrandtii]MBP2411588.1 integral membrane protein (TIGR01906 family) [Arthrobacter stackebrandtii]PYG99265.1 TIGR01906 family membrane protein [Arthrobacter stackebrandtii]